MRLTAVLVVVALGAVGCSDNDPTPIINIANPTAPTPAPPPACQANRTGEVSFENLGNEFLNVELDGVFIGVLPPYRTGFQQSVAANVAHTLLFQMTNTQSFPCPVAMPIAVQCATVTWTSCYY